MNDRHPPGTPTPAPAPDADYAPYGSYDQSAQHIGYGYDGYATGTFTATGFNAPGAYDGTGVFDTSGSGLAVGGFPSDPLFGELPGQAYDTGQWATTGQHPLGHDGFAAQQPSAPGSPSSPSSPSSSYDTGDLDTTGLWGSAGYRPLADIPAQPGPDTTATWDAAPWADAQQTGQWATQVFDTGAYDATAWNSAGGQETYDASPQAYDDTYGTDDRDGTARADGSATETDGAYETADTGADAYRQSGTGEGEFTPGDGTADTSSDTPGDELGTVEPGAHLDEHAPVERPRATRGAGRTRSRSRRSPAKRSALLTVAVPSACVMGVAGVAAASVGGLSGGDDDKRVQAAAAPDPATVQPSTTNTKLDTQLANLSADAGDFADRASRTQERIDLKAAKEAAHKKAIAEAARKERLRPKFALPVSQHGLSAHYGQAGINWMSAHSGIDFPVSYGTPVMAATDGVVSTKWNSAYGNMAIVTAKDGTETWYCHLSTHKISHGPVKAGDVIAYSGNSGNSTGPHLHFEVRPGGGSAIDPLPWLRSHGLDPT
ncbi:M23 family metallopeptidase [Streptomyces sp. CC224B]|uniref:M23 family metallopeptidase n=1 Tax=Streptomyces sp. CC224B TaxID=3044571 RepID=UPI0024A7ECDC|nr:M23 family metallopeptidase [Streptomyces sp. CC224B]